MSVKFAVLGLLTERRGYGYDIANRLEQRLGPSFRSVGGAVYVSLDQLVKQQLAIESRRVQAGRSLKIYYEATPEGVAEFAAWMKEPPSREPLRGELYLKLAVARGDHLPDLRLELEQLERQCITELQEQTTTMALGPSGRSEVTWDVAARWLTDAAALERLNGDLRWIRMALLTIRHAGADGSITSAALMRAVSATD